jgi:hypothetical protein
MPTNDENDQQPEAPDPQPSTPVDKMLGALDELLAATKRVAGESGTTADRIAGDVQPSLDPPEDSR